MERSFESRHCSFQPLDTHINDCPNEILVYILQLLGPADRFSAHDVCQRWQILLDQLVGVALHIGLADPNIWETYPGPGFRSLAAIQQYGATKAFISMPQTPQPVEPLDPTLYWKNSALLRYLWIDGFIHPILFDRFMHGLKNLQTLEIHFSTFSSLESSEDLRFIGVPNLRNFSIRMVSSQPMTFPSIGRGLQNIIKLLESSTVILPRIKAVYLGIPLVNNYLHAVTRAVCRFLRRHANSITKFNLHCVRYAESTRTYYGPPILPLTLDDISGIHLEALEVQCASNAHPAMRIFNLLACQQARMKSISIGTSYLAADVFCPMLDHSFHTLKHIQLAIDPYGSPLAGGFGDFAQPLNLQIFRNCPNLVKLGLAGNRRDIFSHDGVADICGVNQLPSTVQSLTLINLLIKSTDCADLLAQKTNLRKLRMYNAGTDANFGIPFEILYNFICSITNSNLKLNISLTYSINMGTQPCNSSTEMLTCWLLARNNGMSSFNIDTSSLNFQEPVETTYPDGARVCYDVEDIFVNIDEVDAELSDEVDEDYVIPNLDYLDNINAAWDDFDNNVNEGLDDLDDNEDVDSEGEPAVHDIEVVPHNSDYDMSTDSYDSLEDSEINDEHEEESDDGGSGINEGDYEDDFREQNSNPSASDGEDDSSERSNGTTDSDEDS